MNSAKKTVLTSSSTLTCRVPSSSDTMRVPQMPPSVIGPTRSLPMR
ncbi:hypothetical protein SCALM49S_05294 [Streptomyces californicus]